MSRNRDALILTGILLLALLLRIWGLNGPLWYDEVVTLDTHLSMDWSGFFGGYEMNYHYFHNIFAKLSVDLFGPENWAVRLPAMLFGVGSIWLVWILARDVTDTRIAHVVALLLALSYHHIWFSQNARGYTEMAFWGTAGTILYLRGLTGRGSLTTWLFYAVTLAATIFTHLTGAFLFAAHGLVWLIALAVKRDTPFRLPALAYVVGAVLTTIVYMPLLPSLVETVTGVSETSAVDVMSEYQNPLWSLLEGLRTGLGSAGPVVTVAALGVFALMALGSVTTGWLLPAIFMAHLVLTVLALSILGMRIWPRFFFTDIGLALVLIVPGVAMVCGWVSRLLPRLLPPRRCWRLAVLAMVVLSSLLAVRNYLAPKQNLAGAVQFVAEENPWHATPYAITFSADLFNSHFGTNWSKLATEEDFEAMMADPAGALIVVTFPQRAFRLFPELRDLRKFETIRWFKGTLGDGNIIILKRE